MNDELQFTEEDLESMADKLIEEAAGSDIAEQQETVAVDVLRILGPMLQDLLLFLDILPGYTHQPGYANRKYLVFRVHGPDGAGKKITDKNGTEHPFTSLRAALLFAETNEEGLLEKKAARDAALAAQDMPENAPENAPERAPEPPDEPDEPGDL